VNWSTGAQGYLLFVSNTITTVYSFTASLGACSTAGNYTLFVDTPPITPTIINMGSYLTTTVVGTSYQWYLDGNILPAETNFSITPTQIGWYMVRVNNGVCEAFSDGYQILSLGLNEMNVMNGLSIGPNPAKDQLNLRFTKVDQAEIQYRIYNNLGQLVQKSEIKLDQNHASMINIQSLSPGIYTLDLIIGKNKNTSKFVKQ
jgi:hypothetical protein